MSVILTTGRTRTVTYSGSISATGQTNYIYLNVPPDDEFLQQKTGSGYLSALGAQVTWNALDTSERANLGGTSKLKTTLAIITGQGESASGEHVHSYTSGTALYDETPSGVWSVTAGLEECAEVTLLTGAYAHYANVSRTSALTEYDCTPSCAVRLYERFPVGGTLTVAATFGTIDLTASHVFGTAGAISGYACDRHNATSWHNTGGTAYSRMTAKYVDGRGGGTIVLGWAGTVTKLGSKIDYTNGADLSATQNDAGSTADSSRTPDKKYDLDIAARAMEQTYPGTLTFTVAREASDLTHAFAFSGGGYTDSNTQLRYSGSASIQGSVATTTVDQWAQMAVAVTSASLAANGEDAIDPPHTSTGGTAVMDTGVQLRCWYRQVAGLTHDELHNVDTCNYGTATGGTVRTHWSNPYGYWKASGAGSVAVGGTTTLKLSSSDGSGEVDRYFQLDPDQVSGTAVYTPLSDWLGYRYLAVNMRCTNAQGTVVDDQTCRLTVRTTGYEDGWVRCPATERTWVLRGRQTGESGADGWVTRYLDLCAPETISVSAEGGATGGYEIGAYLQQEIDNGAGAWVTYYLEQAVEGGLSEHGIDSRWPTPTNDGEMSGVTVPAFVDALPGRYADATATDVETSPALRFTSMAAGIIYEIDWLSLARTTRAKVSVMPSRRWWKRANRQCESNAYAAEVGETWEQWYKGAEAPEDTDATTRTHVARNIVGEVDGKQSLEVHHALRVITNPPTNPNAAAIDYTDRTILSEVEDIGALQAINNRYHNPTSPWALNTVALGAMYRAAGWHCTEASDSSTGRGLEDAGTVALTVTNWVNGNRPGYWLAGAGLRATAEGTATLATWKEGIDETVDAGTYAMYAQVLADTVDWYPGAGDAFAFLGTAPATGELVMRAGKVLRDSGWGLVFASAGHDPVSGAVGTWYECAEPPPSPYSGAVAGTAATDSLGQFRTTIPHGKGHVDHFLRVTGCGTDILYRPAYARKRHRGHFLTSTGEWISTDMSPAWRHLRAYTSSGNIVVGAGRNVLGNTWDDNTPGVAGAHPCARVDRSGRAPHLWVAYETAAGAVAWLRSGNEGRGYTAMGTVFASGRYPTMTITPDGRRFVYALAGTAGAGTAIYGALYDAQGTLLRGPYTAWSGTVDADAIACHPHVTGGGVWRMHLAFRSNGAIVDVSSVDGITFT